MPRKTRKRRIFLPPKGRIWSSNSPTNPDIVNLTFDEYEAIKLLDYEGLKQEQVAELMYISRPTLTRIYFSARKKIAQALVCNSNIKISGGNVDVHDSWHYCTHCAVAFNIYTPSVYCPLCKKVEGIERIADTM